MRGLTGGGLLRAALLRAVGASTTSPVAGRRSPRLGLGLGRVELGDVRAEAAVLHDDSLPFSGLTPSTRSLHGASMSSRAFAGGELVGREVLGQVHAARRGSGRAPLGDLEVGPVLADAQRDVVRDPHRVDLARVDVAEVVDDLAEAAVLVSEPK